MRKFLSCQLIAAGVLLLAIAACDQGTTEPEPQPGEPGMLADPEVPIFDVGPAGGTRGGPCVYSEADGYFTCPEVTKNGITLSRRYTLYDADGNTQSRFDRLTTASIKTETTAKGTTTTRDGAKVTIDRKGVMVVSGLEGEETQRTLNGTEGGTIVSEFTNRDGAKVTVNSTVADTTVNLVIPVGRDLKNHWPLSGTRIHAVVSTRKVEGQAESQTKTLKVKETFDGTSVVQVEITSDSGTRTCTRDLATRTSTCTR